MRPNGSLDAPIILDDDDTPGYVPVTTVRRRNRQTLEQDGIEEVPKEQQAAAAWKLAAARRQAKQRNTRNLSNDVSEQYGNARDSNLAKQSRERTSSAKSVDIVGLVINEAEAATSGQTTQRGANAGDRQPTVNAARPSIPQHDTHHEAVLPQRAKPPEPTQLVSLESADAMDSSASPTCRPPYLSPSIIARRLEPGVDLPDFVKPYSWPSGLPAATTDSSAKAHAVPERNNHLNSPEYRTTSVLATSNKPTAPVLSHAVPPPIQPIRDVAGNHRERITPSRVNTAFERDDAGVDGDDNDMAIPLPTKAQRPNVPPIPILPRTKKAIKSVPLKPRNNGFSKSGLPVRPPHQLPDNEQDVPSVFPERLDAGLSNTKSVSPVIMHRSQSKDPSVDTNNIASIKSFQAEKPEERDTTPNQPTLPHHQEVREVIPERAVSTTALLSRPATPTVQPSVRTSVEHTQALELPRPLTDTTAAEISDSAEIEMVQNNGVQPENPGLPDGYNGGQASTVLSLQADVLITTRSAIEECLKRHIAKRHESHAYLVWAKMLRQRTFQERELRARGRKQKRPSHSTLPERYVQETSPFKNMSPIQVPFDRSVNTKRMLDMTQEVFVKAKPKDVVIKSGLAALTTKYKSDAPMIPPFKEYVSLRNNILADNESKLLATPYFQDEDYSGREVLLDTLPYIYEMIHDENGPLDFRKEQCRFYKDAIEAFLSETGISWNVILYWLLAPERNIIRINDSMPGSRQFEAYLLERSRYHVEEFERDGEPKKNILFNRNDKKWREFLPQLKEPSTSALRLAATACEAVLQQCEFSIWYLAHQSEAVQNHVAKKTARGQASKQSTYREIMCRVCHQYVSLCDPEDAILTFLTDTTVFFMARLDKHPRTPGRQTPRMKIVPHKRLMTPVVEGLKPKGPRAVYRLMVETTRRTNTNLRVPCLHTSMTIPILRRSSITSCLQIQMPSILVLIQR
jgi:histone-lysine N-methyltransferase EZH2